MASVETPRQSVSTCTYLARSVVSFVANRFFLRKDVLQGPENGLSNLEEQVRVGNGAVILSNHFSLLEPELIVGALIDKEVFRRKKIVIPIGAHQYYRGMTTFGRLMGVEFCPQITDNTKEKINKLSNKGTGNPEDTRKTSPVKKALGDIKRKLYLFMLPSLKEAMGDEKALERARISFFFSYLNKGIKVVDEGNILVVFDQAERQAILEKPSDVMRILIHKTTKPKEITRFAIVGIGVGITGVRDYGHKSIRGYNLRTLLPFFPKYTLNFGESLLKPDFLKKANDHRLNPDELTFEQRLLIVPPDYRPRESALLKVK